MKIGWVDTDTFADFLPLSLSDVPSDVSTEVIATGDQMKYTIAAIFLLFNIVGNI